MKLWIVTREENQYDQYGEYFVAAFTYRPSDSDLRFIAAWPATGRSINMEDTWFNLREVEEGELFNETLAD
jgi:hypothetical protein